MTRYPFEIELRASTAPGLEATDLRLTGTVWFYSNDEVESLAIFGAECLGCGSELGRADRRYIELQPGVQDAIVAQIRKEYPMPDAPARPLGFDVDTLADGRKP